MGDDDRALLEDEGRAFAEALTGRAPDDDVVVQYARAHQHLALQASVPFDHVLLDFACQGPWALRAADGYARFFASRSALRRKLAVLVAILESSAPSDEFFASREATLAGVLVQLLLAGSGFALLFGVGILALAPQQLAARWWGGDP